MRHKEVIAKLQNLPPPRQPWLISTMADYTEKLVDWNPMYIKSGALYYQFTTGPDQNECFILPDACLNILFSCDEKDPSAWVSGMQESAFRISLKPDTTYFGFKPYSINGIKNLNSVAAELKNTVLPMEQVLPVRPELEMLSGTASINERISIFQNYALSYLTDEKYASNYLEYCATLLCATDGRISTEDLESTIGYSRHHCCNKFKEQYGITIKQYSRFMRFQYTLLRMMTDNGTDLTQIANDAGYYDQSHFINEFRNLATIPPNDFRDNFKKLLDSNQRYYCPSAQASRAGSSVINRRGPQ